MASIKLDGNYLIKLSYDDLYVKQKEIYDLYYECNRNWDEVGRRLKRPGKAVQVTFSKQLKLRIAIYIRDYFNDIKHYTETPTLEWSLTQLMRLYNDYEERFEALRSNKDPEVYDMIESIKTKMCNLLKQITDFQNKFGQMIDDDILKISKLADHELSEEINKMIEESKEYLSRKKWYDNKKNDGNVARLKKKLEREAVTA
jgi:regulator of replication initiation timing